MTTIPTPPAAPFGDIIDAMRSLVSETDRWQLAEALRAEIPSGRFGFDQILERARAAGVSGKLSVATLMAYRDTAGRWPEAKRVSGVSFTAHRECERMIEEFGIDAAAKMLRDLASRGPVTVSEVRRSVALKRGRVPAGQTIASPGRTGAAAPAAPPVAPTGATMVADLVNGSPMLIKAIKASNTGNPQHLNTLRAGLNKALAEVEAMVGKANRKAKAAKVKPAAPVAAEEASTKVAPKAASNGARKVGDLRGF